MLRLSLTPHNLHFKRPAQTSRGPLVARALWLVRTWDTAQPGVVGLGECGPIADLSADDGPTFGAKVAALIDEFNHAAIALPDCGDWIAWLDALLAPGESALAALPSLRFGLESALLDLRSGGQGIYFDTPFTRAEAPLPTHGLIWMEGAAGVMAQVDAKVGAGFPVIKMKVGALPFAEELALLSALRARYPSVALRLDANGAFTVVDAPAKIAALASLDIEFIEQPLQANRRDALAALCAASAIPIVLDEELIGLPGDDALRTLLESVRPQGIIIKPALLGGWRAATRAAALCTELGVAWWANSLLESSIGHDAICQWTAQTGGERVHGLGTGGLYRDNFASPIRLVGNMLWRNRAIASRDRGAIAH
jgi:o-succinylbenzoate synthase